MDKLKNLLKSDTPTEGSSTTGTSHAGTGSAAIGDTSTYSSSHLGQGDPTSSVVDPRSNDPLTYTKPESSNLASLPGHENPYRASSLDPRVDGGKKSDAPIISKPSETQSYGTSQEHGTTAASTVPAPSSLTSTANPVDRSTEYGNSSSIKGLENATSSTTASSYPSTAGTGTGTTSNTGNTGATRTAEQPSVIGQALGAVGLGGLAGSLGYSTGQSAHTDTASQPTTTTGVDSSTAPTRQGPPAHYRRESIPTTAYPAGIDSPRAINAPVGGTRSSIDQTSQQPSHGLSGAGIGAATGGSNVVSGSTPAHTSSTPSSTAQTTGGFASGPTLVHNAITVGDEAPITSSGLRDSTVIGHGILHPEGSTGVPPYTSTQESGKFTSTPLKDESHTGRNAAGGGAAAAAATAAGVGAYASHEHGHTTGSSTTAPLSSTQGSGKFTSAPLSSTQDSGKFTSAPLKDQGYTSTGRDTTLGGTSATTAPRTTAATSAPLGTTQESGKFTSTPLKSTQESGKFTSTPLQGETHTGRDAALGGAAAAAVGAGAYGAHEHKDQAAHQKELEKAEKAHQKEVEKEQKREEKELHKEEKSHQKELEKEHKKEEKVHQHELATLAKKHDKEEARLTKDLDERERKPSIFKRIFKRRKNKETGLDEDYSTDEDEGHHKGALAGAGVAGATGAAVAHDRATTGNTTTTTGEGFNKPSYNPLSHEDPAHTTATTARPIESITGLPYDPSKDPVTAESLRTHSQGTGAREIDPIAAGSFKMGEIVDKKHGQQNVSHGTETGTGTGVGTSTATRGLGHEHEHSTGTGVGTGVGTSAATHGLGHSSATGTTTATEANALPHRPTNAAPGDSTQHYDPTASQGQTGDRHLSTAEALGSPTTHNITAPGSEPQNLGAKEIQHIHETGEHEGLGTQLKDSFKLGGL